MPRKKGIAESRKGKRKPPPKPQEKAKASTMPDDTASEHESTASGGNSPVDELDGMAADVRPVRKAAHEAMKRLEQALDDIDETHDEYMYEEAMYNFSKTCISATTRARGEAATREAALLAENKILKARLANDEQHMLALEAQAEASEARAALCEQIIEDKEEIVQRLEYIIRILKRKLEKYGDVPPVSS